MAFLDLQRGRMWYEVHGPADAPWAVILPGAAIAGWMYEPLRDRLAASFRVLTLEYRGIGRSRNELWAPSPGLLAEDVLALLDHVGAERAHAVGFSLGTFVMAEMLRRQPARLDRCAIGCMPVVRGRWDPPEDAGDGLLPQDLPEAMTWTQLAHVVLPMFFSPWFKEAHRAQYDDAVKRVTRQSAKEMLAGLSQLNGVLAYDYNGLRAYGDLPRGRRLFLVGETDAMTRPSNLRAHPFTSAGPTIVFRRSGHVFFYEQPDAVAQVVQHFWRTGAPPARLAAPAPAAAASSPASSPASAQPAPAPTEPEPVPLEALA